MTPVALWVVLLGFFLGFLDLTLGSKTGTRAFGVITIARCRAKCLGRFLKRNSSDENCQRSKRCNSCWSLCQDFFIADDDTYGQICNKKEICNGGCQAACQFKKNVPKATVTEGWKFTDQPAILADLVRRTAYMAWTKPVPKNAVPDLQNVGKPFFVFVLLAREQTKRKGNNAWRQVLQTGNEKAYLDLGGLPYAPEFWILAVSENGTVAQKVFNSTFAEEKPEGPDVIPAKAFGFKDSEIEIDRSSPLNITMNMTVVDGKIKPVITWENPPSPVPRNKQYNYQVDAYLNNCDCDLPSEHFAHFEVVKAGEEPVTYLEGVVFNAEYHLEITLLGKKDWKGNLRFTTPLCNQFASLDFTECEDDMGATDIKTIIKSSPTPTTTHAWDFNSSTPNMMSGTGSDETTSPSGRGSGAEADIPRIERPLLVHNPIDWNITQVGKSYDPVSEHVFVKLTWHLPFGNPVRQEVLSYHLNESNPHGAIDINRQEVDGQSITLKLKPHRSYNVRIQALYMTSKGQEEEIRSKEKIIDTNHVESLPLMQSTSSARQAQEKEILNGIILGVTVVSSIIIFGIIVLFIYKKRQSFRDIIITKTAVAKSNSYKSNVGCKVDYSNQMLMSSDDWELDCRQLKFASPIGQGAFGKVVTGYFQDQRVAIKLVRDCAPLSYKEDLLAEINLMKRLGSHPNIVSMIGACTLAEPIALVMEYIPFGNLQNFLKKCRLEGELTVQAGRCPELNYSIMDEHGGINEGVIKPADMLSFARQVAMAMEYLTDKKYVHRDLAARNVLLGYDKVIKVCDFGLSRDIYNDNQYKKLTNGKLPLKWMAIESLRDRVFTTQSDVWSFGVLLWEIVTMGASPYPNIALADLYYVLSNHYRMEKPSNCSDEVYIIMRQCWLENPKDRPTFTDLRVQLEMLLSRDRNYLELDNINVPLSTPESSSGSPVSDDTASLLAAQALQTTRKSSKDELTVSVCIHEKSMDRLLKRKAEFDPHDITIL